MKEESLQKFTESDCKKILQSPLTDEFLEGMPEEDRDFLFAYLNKEINVLKGEELDKLWMNVEPIAAQSSKNQMWERNHMKITFATGKLMTECGRMPTPGEIADETKLSRVTVSKHLKGYKSSPIYQQQIDQFIFMRDKVLAKVYKFAVEGNMKAAKLFLEYTGGNGSQGNTYNTQNNYIQVNDYRITQEAVKQLTPDQIKQIEGILKSVSKPNEKASLT